MNNNFQIQLNWEDPRTKEQRSPSLSMPIAFGREFSQMPTTHQGQRVARMVLSDRQVSDYHALIDLQENQLIVTDKNSANGIKVNGQSQTQCILAHGDILQMGSYIITVHLNTKATQHNSINERTVPPSNFLPNTFSLTEIFPAVSKKLDLHQNGFLVPGIVTVIFVAAMLLSRTSDNPYNFLYILAAYLASASHYLIHKLCHKHKPWWLLVSLALATGLPLTSDSVLHFLAVNKKDDILISLFKAFPAELFKVLPVLLLYWLGRLLASPKRSLIGVWEPMDGILLSTASATGFALVETMMHVHEEVAVTSNFFNATTLLIPQILGDISGQVAYSGYFGYFIGLSALKPSKRWRLLGIGYVISSSVHALWAVVTLLQEKQNLPPFTNMLLAVIGVAIASTAYAFFMAAILKARQLSPHHS